MIHLVLGGARSGKSTFAEQLAQESGLTVRYVATATAGDDEMHQRIQQHRERRPDHWALQEVPLELCELIETHQNTDELLLIDCLTLWLTNQLLHPSNPDLQKKQDELCAALAHTRCSIVLVSNEVGMGIVPLGEISRRFVDQAGYLNQAVARVANRVTFIAAGLPLELKSTSSA